MTSSVRENHRELLGNRLGQMADYAQLAVRANLAETVQTVAALTVTPNIIDLVTRENKHLLTPQEILARIDHRFGNEGDFGPAGTVF